MRELRYTLLADGGSDRALMYVIDWMIGEYIKTYSGYFAATNLPHSEGLYRRTQWALKFYPCDILFVHRDAESMDYDLRIAEICRDLTRITNAYIPIVPVRMTEAWLLSSESAIREAAGNPNGNQPLNLPAAKKWDRISDPKAVLFEALRSATGLQGRRLDKFNLYAARLRVAQRTEDFSALDVLPAFRKLSEEIRQFFKSRTMYI